MLQLVHHMCLLAPDTQQLQHPDPLCDIPDKLTHCCLSDPAGWPADPMDYSVSLHGACRRPGVGSWWCQGVVPNACEAALLPDTGCTCTRVVFVCRPAAGNQMPHLLTNLRPCRTVPTACLQGHDDLMHGIRRVTSKMQSARWVARKVDEQVYFVPSAAQQAALKRAQQGGENEKPGAKKARQG